jgi:class 3 adenylate cyclase
MDSPEPGPSSPRRLAETLEQVRESLRTGNYLLAHDQAARALEAGLRSRTLDYLTLLALANAGSTQLALTRLRALHLTQSELDEDWLALEGRLLKDLAAGAADPQAMYLEAGAAYHAAFLRTGGYFSAINAATTLLLGGQANTARQLAADVLARVLRFQAASELDEYYLRVTEAEAALLLGESARVEASLRAADQLLPGNLNVRSRTTNQLRLICRALGQDEAVLSALTLAPVLHILGCVEESAVPEAASFVFVGLIGPEELAVVELFQKRAARLHLVLPTSKSDLLESWQRRHGPGWTMRLARCLDLADELSVVQGFLAEEEGARFAYVTELALGLSQLAARRLGCRWQQLGTAPDISVAASLPNRCFIGTFFADFAGYSRLSEAEIPKFQTRFMAPIASLLKRHRERILLQHSWGDAIHVVTVDAETAADIAAEIHTVVERVRPSFGGALSNLNLRLGAHYGPVFRDHDPIENSPTYYGSQISFAARIEPITPPGMVFVTEAFAARLALESPRRFALEYAGEIALAKSYGTYRLFSSRRLSASRISAI